MRLLLTVESENDQGRRVQLKSGQSITVGRTELSEMSFPYDSLMSSRHFTLTCSHSKCLLRDLGSTSGTQINGSIVAEIELQDQDEVFAGSTRFKVSISERSSEANPKPNASSIQSGNPGSQGLNPHRALENLIPNLSGRPFADGFRDDDPSVRREALFCAAWTRQNWLLNYCRAAARTANEIHWPAVMMLGILGDPSDLALVIEVGNDNRFSSQRYQLLGAFGHPAVVNSLIAAMQDPDPNVAIEAGKAFTKITGVDVASDNRVVLPPENGAESDEFESEFAEEDFTPDPQQAFQHWNRVHQQFAQSTRVRRGHEISAAVAPSVWSILDMRSRYEIILSDRFHGRANHRLNDIDKFPLRSSI